MRDASDRALLKAFGASVRAQREQQGISQERLAELANIHRTYIGGIERGERNLALVNIRRVAVALDTPLSELMTDVERRLAP